MATIMKTDGRRVETAPKNGKYFELDELQSVVGGYIEIIHLDDGRIMVVNEEGKLYHLPVNTKATILYGYGIIVGDVLICSNNEIR